MLGPAPRICLVRTDRLGDTVLALPAAMQLREAMPQAHIALWVRKPMAGLVAHCTAVDAVHQWDPSGSITELSKHLRRQQFDVAILGHSRAPTALALFHAGIRWRVGNGHRWFSPLFTHRLRHSRSAAGLHEADTVRALCQLICKHSSTTARIAWQWPQAQLQQQTAAWQQLGLAHAPVVLQPASSGSSLDWPLELMSELARKLQAEGHEVAIHLGPNEGHLAELFPSCPSFGSELSLDQLAMRLHSARCLVGNSTGPLHLAAAVGTPVVGLYPRVSSLTPRRWGPIGSSRRTLMSPGSELYAKKSEAPAGHMAGISIASVVQAVNAVARG